jgi:hypothetical protein
MISKIKNLNVNYFFKNYTKKVIRPNPLTVDYDIEKAEFDKNMKEYRKKHQKEFWEEQTKIENKYIEEFLETQKKKKIKDDAKERSRIINHSYVCYQNIVKNTNLEKND